MDRKTKSMDESTVRQFVSFILGNETYGLDIMMAESIERIASITPVPKTPGYVSGVTNIRGEIIPIINLRKRMGMEAREYDEDTRIIISRFDEYRIGMIVDRVNDVFSVSETRVQRGKDIFKGEKNNFISGVIDLQQDYLLVLDLIKVLGLGE